MISRATSHEDDNVFLIFLFRPSEDPDVSPSAFEYDARVTAMVLVTSSRALWIGTGCGQIIVVDANNYTPITVIQRHLSTVRDMKFISLPGQHQIAYLY